MPKQEVIGMNPEVKARWLAALRSGEYAQARERLRDRTGAMCCLGVLCDLYAKDYPEVAWERVALGEKTRWWTFGGAELEPPADVARWAGLRNEYDQVVYNPMAGDLSVAEANDNGQTFAEIADLIESHIPAAAVT